MSFQWILRADLPVAREQALRHLGRARAARAARPAIGPEDLPPTLPGRALLSEVDPDLVQEPWLRRRLLRARRALFALVSVAVPESPDPVRRHFLWAAGTAAVRAMVCRVEEAARRRWAPERLSPAWSPGTRGWDLTAGQRALFSVLDGAALGVDVLPSGAMSPALSLSLALAGGDYREVRDVPCLRCADLRCPARGTGGVA